MQITKRNDSCTASFGMKVYRSACKAMQKFRTMLFSISSIACFLVCKQCLWFLLDLSRPQIVCMLKKYLLNFYTQIKIFFLQAIFFTLF